MSNMVGDGHRPRIRARGGQRAREQWNMIREKYRGQRCQRWSLNEAVVRGGWREELWTGLSNVSERKGEQ